MVCHDISWIVMTCHQPIQKGITSDVSDWANRFGPACLCVHLSALSWLNCWTYRPKWFVNQISTQPWPCKDIAGIHTASLWSIKRLDRDHNHYEMSCVTPLYMLFWQNIPRNCWEFLLMTTDSSTVFMYIREILSCSKFCDFWNEYCVLFQNKYNTIQLSTYINTANLTVLRSNISKGFFLPDSHFHQRSYNDQDIFLQSSGSECFCRTDCHMINKDTKRNPFVLIKLPSPCHILRTFPS